MVSENIPQESCAFGPGQYYGEEEKGDGIHTIVGDHSNVARDVHLYLGKNVHRG